MQMKSRNWRGDGHFLNTYIEDTIPKLLVRLCEELVDVPLSCPCKEHTIESLFVKRCNHHIMCNSFDISRMIKDLKNDDASIENIINFMYDDECYSVCYQVITDDEDSMFSNSQLIV